uniref:Scaffolding protein n=1 Tax=Dulem virus 32 TaxID=3145750 RepID=A0AAU8B284_9CAUD
MDTTTPAETPQDSQATPQPPSAPSVEGGDEKLGDGGKKALDAERRRARDLEKQLKAAADKLAAIEDAEKTDLQRATDAAAKAKQDAEEARRDLARERIARKHRLSDDDTALLSGSEEQMEALAARLAAASTPLSPPEGGQASTPASPAAQAAAATAAGDAAAAFNAKIRMLAEHKNTK